MKLPVKAFQNESVKMVWYLQDADGVNFALGVQEAIEAIVETINDAAFMAHVWKDACRELWLDESKMKDDGGDPEGVDFVADRILAEIS